jgi:hypothetical protein
LGKAAKRMAHLPKLGQFTTPLTMKNGRKARLARLLHDERHDRHRRRKMTKGETT